MEDPFGPYGVQLLMDGTKLMKAFLIWDKSIFAISGGCHPVVASSVSELLYQWGLAGRGDEWAMRDIPESLSPKSFEKISKELDPSRSLCLHRRPKRAFKWNVKRKRL
jgi:hypothetical protein